MGSVRRQWVLRSVGLGLAGVLVIAIFARGQIVETWNIYRLDSEDPAITDLAAARLGAANSPRAIRALIDQIPREIEKGRRINMVTGPTGQSLDFRTDSAVYKALYDMGEPAKDAINFELTRDLEKFRILGDLWEVMEGGYALHDSKEIPLQKMR